jgi:hypothetical protein
MAKPSDREARLAEALRANLRRRKAQTRTPRTDADTDTGAPATGVAGDDPDGEENLDRAPAARPNPAPKRT